MQKDAVIKNADELEFSIFCIENIARKLGKNAEEVYEELTKKSDLLYSYIVPGYDVLHTQGKEYIVDDIIGVMIERSLETCLHYEGSERI